MTATAIEVDNLEDLMNDEPPTCNCWYVREGVLCGKEAHWRYRLGCGCRLQANLACHEHKATTDELSRLKGAQCRQCGAHPGLVKWTPI